MRKKGMDQLTDGNHSGGTDGSVSRRVAVIGGVALATAALLATAIAFWAHGSSGNNSDVAPGQGDPTRSVTPTVLVNGGLPGNRDFDPSIDRIGGPCVVDLGDGPQGGTWVANPLADNGAFCGVK